MAKVRLTPCNYINRRERGKKSELKEVYELARSCLLFLNFLFSRKRGNWELERGAILTMFFLDILMKVNC